MSTLNFRKDISKLGHIQIEKKMVRSQKENFTQKFKGLGMFSLEKRRLWRYMAAVFRYLRGCHEDDGQTFSGKLQRTGQKTALQ